MKRTIFYTVIEVIIAVTILVVLFGLLKTYPGIQSFIVGMIVMYAVSLTRKTLMQ